jgi:hypothetical protein
MTMFGRARAVIVLHGIDHNLKYRAGWR